MREIRVGNRVRIVDGPWGSRRPNLAGTVTKVVRGVLYVTVWPLKMGARALIHPQHVEKIE